MKIREYIYSKIPYLLGNLIIYLFFFVILKIAGRDPYYAVILFLVWFMPLVIYLLIDCISKKKFYDSINDVMNDLDQKYLLPEVIKKPKFYEGEIIYDILQESNRNMHEHVSFYKNLQSDYREYIEAWVHEIKTPIASSKMIIENNGGKIKLSLDDEMNKIQDYVEQVLYYSRSTGVSNDYLIREFSLKESVSSIVRRNRRTFINKKIKVDIEGVSHQVVTDKKWIEFIINQIMVNSINYSKAENAVIKVYSQKSKNSVVLTIEDNGVGICEQDISRVFNKGFTGENGRKYGRSTGIGLYLCKKLCEKLGLSIELASKENQWTRVDIIFPSTNLTKF